MPESIVAGNLVLDLTVDPTNIAAEIRRHVQNIPAVQVKVDVDAGSAERTSRRVKDSLQDTQQAATAMQQRLNGLFQGLGNDAEGAAKRSAQAFRDTAAEEARLSREGMQRLRDRAATAQLNARLQRDAERQAQEAITSTIRALDNEQRAQRNLWQSRQLSDNQVVEVQQRIYRQALLQAQAVDTQSDAYRRLTQVMAAAQRTADQAQGINTPGGFGSGITQGIQAALSQFGVAGDLLGGFVQYIAAKRATAVSTAEHLGSDTIAGLVKGMKSDQAEVKATAEKTANSVESAVREELDIHSPSRVMEYLGRMVGDGFVSGIRSRWDDAKRAAAGLSDAARSGIRPNALVGGAAGGGALGEGIATVFGGGMEAGKVNATSDALDGLNKQLEKNAAASVTAANAGAATEVATEALGASVEGAAEHIQSFTDARREEDAAQRAAALNDAKTALAFTAIAAAATAAATAVVLNYNAAADYQAAMLKAQATTEATASQMDRLSEVALSKPLMDLAVNGIDAAAGIEELGSQGLNTAQIIDGGLITSLTLAKAVNADVAKSASVAAAATKAFGLESSEMARVGDIVTNAVNGTSVKMDNFTDAIAAGGAVAQSTGMDFVTFTAAISFMTDKAIAASDAGTSLKSFLQALTPNSAAARDEMKKLGFTAFTADGQFKDLGTVVEELREKFQRLTPEQRATTAETIFGADGIRAFNILVAEGSAGLKTRIELLDRTGTMTAAAEKKLAGARGEQEKFNAALKNFQIVSGEFFLPAGEKVLSFLSQYLAKAVAVNRETEKMNKGLGAFGAQEYNLPSWLQQSGLTANQLSSTETKQVTELLKTMQAVANEGALEATKYRNLGLNAIADQIDLNTLKRIGLLGKELGELQRIISVRESGGNPLAPPQPTTKDQSVLDRMPLDAKAAAFFKAIFGQESGAEKNPYKAFNTDYSNGGGQGALGKYQVMPQNLLGLGWDVPQSQRGAWALANLDNRGVQGAGWDFQALKKDITPREFLNSPEYQEAIAQAQMTANLQKRLLEAGGDLEKAVKEAAKDWYGRKPPEKGPTPDQYAASVWNRFTGQATLGGQTVAIPSKTPLIQTKDKEFSDYIKEAQRLSDAVAKYAPGGSAPNADKWNAAAAQLKKFRESGDLAAKALEWVGLEAGKSGKAVSQYGQTFDRLKGQLGITENLRELGASSQEYLKSLDGISKAALTAANAEKAKNGETEKYRQLLNLSGDAAKKASNEHDRLTREGEAHQRAAEQREKEAQQAAARLNENLRQGKIEAARNELTRLQQMREHDLRNAGENAQQIAQVEQRYATLTYNAKAAIALKERQDRDADIKNDKTLNGAARAQALANSEATYRNALTAAANERAAVQDRIDTQATNKARTTAVQGVQITKSATDALIVELTRRAEEIDRINSEINDAEIAATNARYQNVNAATDAAMRGSYGVGPDGLAAALKGYGVRSVDELMTINPTAAESIRRVYAAVFEQMAADLEQAAQDSLNIIDYYKAEADRLADETAGRAESGARQISDRDAQRVAVNTRAPSVMLSFLGGAGNEWFGDKFGQLGEEGRAAFLARLNAVTPEDFAAVPLALLKSVRAKIGDSPEWQDLKKRIDDGISLNLTAGSNAGGWKELGGLAERFAALDGGSAGYADTLTNDLIPALAALRGRVTDPELQAAIDRITEGLNGEADAARQLAQLLGQRQVTALEGRAGQMNGVEYAQQRAALLTQLENDAWKRQSAGLTEGTAAYELAYQQHQDRLTAITRQGEQDRLSAENAAQLSRISLMQSAVQRGGGNAARAELAAAINDRMDTLTQDLARLPADSELAIAKLTELQNLAGQLEDVRMSLTLEINGFDTGLRLIDAFQTATNTLSGSLDANFQKVAQGSMAMSDAVMDSVTAMTVTVIDQLQKQVIATMTAALATDILTGNWVKAAIDVAVIGGVGIGGGLLKGVLNPGSPTIKDPSKDNTTSGSAGRYASSAPAITYHAEANVTFNANGAYPDLAVRSQFRQDVETIVLDVMARTGQLNLPAALPAS